MRAVDIIGKVRDHIELSRQEIEFFIKGYTSGEITDYQAAAWAMAVLLNGLTDRETTDLTLAIAHSGETLDLSNVVKLAVDKHSTGGVGDKTTLVVEPIVAACGLPVGKMSGRGLGFSGGTLDKIESIPGYRTDLTREEFITQLRLIGLVLTGQTGDLAPADGKLYALRDVTGTVQSIPLIASSVMSKKIAAGAQAIVLDVKVGNGAFMKDLHEAQILAKLMVSIGKLSGRKVAALLSDMNQPLGIAVGNSLELKEAIDTLHGKGPSDFREHCLVVASHMLRLGGVSKDLADARLHAETILDSGKGFDMFLRLVKAQGGDVAYVEEPGRLTKAALIETIKSHQDGYLTMVHAQTMGESAVELGAGRAKKGDPIDHSVGFEILRKVGDKVTKGDPLFVIHASSIDTAASAKQKVLDAFAFSDEPVEPLPLFYDLVMSE